MSEYREIDEKLLSDICLRTKANLIKEIESGALIAEAVYAALTAVVELMPKDDHYVDLVVGAFGEIVYAHDVEYGIPSGIAH